MKFNIWNKIPTVLTGILFLMIASGPLTAQVSNPSGELEPVDHDLIWAQTLKGSHFNEFWNYHFYLNEGLAVHIVFSAVNFGNLKPPVTGVKVSVVNFNGNTYQLSREYAMEKLLQDRQQFVFRPNPERELYFRGELPNEHMVRIRTSKNDNLYDIELYLENITQGFQLGNGKYNVNGEEIGIVAHIPYAEVKGSVAMNGVKKNVSGTAYMDHTFQNQTTTRLMDSGYRFVHHQDSNNWEMLYFMLPKDSKNNQTIGFWTENNGGEIKASAVNRIVQLVEGDAFGKKIGRIVEVDIGNKRTVRILRTKNQEKFSVFDELGWMARQAARKFLGGEVIDFRGEALLMEQGQKPKKGFYDFFLVD